MKCKDDCIFYLKELDNCMFCSFISANDIGNDKFLNQTDDEFDILNLDEYEWGHKQILKQLHDYGVDCFFVDMWDEIAYITGVNASVGEVARVLGLHRESIYHDHEHCFMILNLFQEKVLRENDT